MTTFLSNHHNKETAPCSELTTNSSNMEAPMKVIDIEFEDNVVTSVYVEKNEDLTKVKVKETGVLPTHPWLPTQTVGPVDETPAEPKISRVKKYFWSKRSAHYTAMRAKAREDRQQKKLSPREILSIIAKDSAIREVLSKVGLYEWECSKLIDNEEEGLDNLTELYLFLLGFFAFTFLIATVFFYIFDGYQSAMLGIIFF